MDENLNYYEIKDTIGPRAVQALRELCQGISDYQIRSDNMSSTAYYQAFCNPRTFDIADDAGSARRAIVQSLEAQADSGDFPACGLPSHIASLDGRMMIDAESLSDALVWAQVIGDLTADLDIYRAVEHMGLVTMTVNGRSPRLSMSRGKYMVTTVTYDITNLGAQVTGFSNGAIHRFEDCIVK